MTTTANDIEPMRQAIAAARAALANGDKPYGATLVSVDGRIVHTAGNVEVSRGDSTGHAEMVLVREAQADFGIAALQGGTVYASGEPCAMCCGALFWAGVSRIVYAAPNRAMAELLGGALLPFTCAELLAHAVPPVQVDGPLLADESMDLLRAAAAATRRT